MVDWQPLRRAHVVRTMAEYDRIGPDRFLKTHDWEAEHEFVLVHDGNTYDSKAIVGVAYGYATGAPLHSDEFSGGKQGAAMVLRDMGFIVRGGGQDDANDYTDAASLDSEESGAAWALAARNALIETAHSYDALVTTKELAALVQQMSRIRSDQPPHRWIGDVLRRVATECAGRDEPLLSSLCVDASGSVGAGYADVVLTVRGESPADPDQHAAHERLSCYRHFGANVPAGGGAAALTPQLKARRERVTSAAQAALRPATLCPVHHVEMPATGVCDLCE